MTKKIILFLLCSLFISNILYGCQSNNKSIGKSVRRYSEEDYNLPVDEHGIVMDLKKFEDGTIGLLICNNSSRCEYYISNDCGKSWVKKEMTIGKEFDSLYFIDGKFSEDKDLLLTYGSEQTSYKTIIISKNGQVRHINIDHSKAGSQIHYYKVSFASNGDILLDNMSGELIQIDSKTCKVKNKYNGIDGLSYCTTNKYLYASSNHSVVKYDLETGKKDGRIKAFDKIISKSSSAGTLFKASQKNKIYLLNSSIAYSYTEGENSSRKVLDGRTNSFSIITNGVENFIECKDKDFLCIFYDSINNQYKLMHYSNLKGSTVSKENRIVVYSLYDNALIRQCIAKYMKKNINVNVQFKTGISDDNAITKSDAIRTLNTEIMAGKGPDIIILDELPINSYIEKGLLENMDDIFTPFKNDNELFNNILEYYSKNDKTYSIPIRIKMPITIGQGVENVNDVTSLSEAINKIATSCNGIILDADKPSEVVKLLYTMDASEWVDEKGNVDRDKIKKYLKACKNIYDTLQTKEANKNIQYHNQQISVIGGVEEFEKCSYLNRSAYSDNLLNGDSSVKIEVGSLNKFMGFSVMITVCNSKVGYSYRTWEQDGKRIFIPETQIGISAKSTKKIIAKDFVSYLFERETQDMDFFGLPINRESFMKNLNKYIEMDSGSSIVYEDGSKITIATPSNEEIDKFLSTVESLKKSAYINNSNSEEAIDEAIAFVSGKVSLNKALNEICSKLEMQLKE